MTEPCHRVMIVDDSQAILLVMTAIMRELGIEDVTTCHSAQQAIEFIHKTPHQYDAIFTDLNMPEMDGMEFIRQLGELKFSGGVIIISEMDNKVIDLAANLARQYNAHLIGNISKPVQLFDVKRMISKLETFMTSQVEAQSVLDESALLHAISHNEIVPYYQPKVHRADKQIKSIEVLARIVKAQSREVFMPAQFINVAEQLDLINLVTFQLFEKAISEFQRIRTQLAHPLKLAFNLSPSQLCDVSCPDKLALILELNHVQPKDIILEITEQQSLHQPVQLETLNRLRIRGFDISLDDFGTGFTNLHQLKTLPFTEIKIDRSLITHVESDRFSQVFIDSLVDIAQNQQLDIVAEGIERVEELQYLERYKFSLLMQGYLIGKPKPLSDFLSWIHSWQRMINSKS